jgi:LysM repeat protein
VTHAVVIVIAVALVSYSAISKDSNITLGLDQSSAAGASYLQGGQVGNVELGGSATIVKPVEIPTSAPAPHTATTYTVTANDDLASIARKYHLTEDDLRWSNPSLLTETTLVQTGEKLLIPPVAGVVITVKSGNTLDELAQAWHVSPQDIVDFNYIRDPSTDIIAGMSLVIPDAEGPTLPAVDEEPPPSTFGASGFVSIGGPVGTQLLNHFPLGECTYYVASQIYIPWMGNAWQWFGNAQAAGWATGQLPRVGAIMVSWESEVYGHVAYVEQVYSNGAFLVSEMNYYAWDVVDERLIEPDTIPLIGFIYPTSPAQ